MSHAAYSHPEREEPCESVPVQTGDIAQIRQRLDRLPETPDPAILTCPKCASPMNVSRGRRSGLWFVLHPKGSCEDSDDLTRIEAKDRESAIQQFLEEMTP